MALLERTGQVTGVLTEAGERFESDLVILACGSWISKLLPALAHCFVRSYHPVCHLRPHEPEGFVAGSFPTFTADIARTGFYGFPFHQEEKVLKIAHHGLSVSPPKDGSLTVPPEITTKLREFLHLYFPPLARFEIVRTRLCPYCDTANENLWIARDPERPGLVVASGGSGHGFKFAPVPGRIIVDIAGDGTVADVTDSPPALGKSLTEKFRWRPELRLERGLEAARCHEEVL